MGTLSNRFNVPGAINAAKYFAILEKDGPDAAFQRLCADLGLKTQKLIVSPGAGRTEGLMTAQVLRLHTYSKRRGSLDAKVGFAETEEAAKRALLIELLNSKDEYLVADFSAAYTDPVDGVTRFDVVVNKAKNAPTFKLPSQLTRPSTQSNKEQFRNALGEIDQIMSRRGFVRLRS